MKNTGLLLSTLFIIGVLCFSAACAPTSRFPSVDTQLAEVEAKKQRAVALKLQFQQSSRLYNVAFHVLAENAELCGDRIDYKVGGFFYTLDDFADEWRDIVHNEYGVTNEVTVLNLVPKSPAERAGLMSGDKILRINGVALRTGKQATKKLNKVFDDNPEGEEMTWDIRRGSMEQTISIEPALSCNYPVQLVNHDSLNAWADGDTVYVTAGMLRFLENDDELALIIGHELAHNTRKHIESKLFNTFFGSLLGSVLSSLTGVDVTNAVAQAGAYAFSQDFETEADYVGVYHAARAGFDVSNASGLWRRIGATHPSAIHLEGSSHPSTAKRYLVVEMGMQEIRRKRSSGLPLVPDEKNHISEDE